MSDVLVRVAAPVDGATEAAPLAAMGLVVARDGVTEGVTFKGRAEDDGGGMLREWLLRIPELIW